MMKKIKLRTNKNGQKPRRQRRSWIISVTAVGFLVAYTVGNSRALAIANLPHNHPAIVTSNRDSNAPLKKFDIVPGILKDVLAAFEKETGWTVRIPDNAQDIASNGVSGSFTEEQALKEILRNTGLVYTIIAPQTVALRLPEVSESVEVVDQNSVLSSPKYTEPLRTTPQTITVIDKETIQQQGATTLRDTLRNVSGLTVAAGEGGAVGGDNLTLRGFSARNDIYVDGARNLSPQSRDPFNLEQVEVVKGPSSVTTGRGSTGGTINLISKTPLSQPTYNFDLMGGTDETKRVTGDINLPLERLRFRTGSAFRLNFVGHDSNYAGREVIGNSRYGIAPSLRMNLSQKSSFTFSYYFLGQNNIQDYGIPFVPVTNRVLTDFRDRPAPVPRDTFYGFLDRDYEALKSHLGTVTFNHAFNDRMTLRNQFRYDYSTRDSNATPPRFNNDNSGTIINRELRAWLTTDRNYDNQTDFTARFNTGRIEHALVAGGAFISEQSRRFNRTAANSLTTLLNPNPNDIYPGTIYTNPLPSEVEASTQAVYLFETVKFHPKFSLNGGLRYERYSAEGFLLPSITLPTATQPVIFGMARARVENKDNLFNVRAAAVYQPVQIGTFYVSYSNANNPSLSGLIYENATVTTLDPEKTRTFEAGTKWDLFKNRLLLSGALFRVEKTNARTPQPDGTLQILTGRQRVNGIELSLTGNFTERWNVLTSYTLLDSRIVESNAFTTVSGVRIFERGQRFINTPRNSFNLWTTYRLPLDITVGGGAQFVDRRFVNTINTRSVDSFWLINATASYRINKHLDVRLNGNNLADKYYFDRFSGGHAVPGPGRAILIGLGVKF